MAYHSSSKYSVVVGSRNAWYFKGINSSPHELDKQGIVPATP